MTAKSKAYSGPRRAQEWVRSERELATALGVAASTVKHWKRLPGAPIADPAGRLNVKEWMEWVTKQGKDLPAIGGTKQEWEVERIKRQVDSLDIEIKRKRGELVHIEDVKRWCGQMVYGFRVEVLGIPGKLAPQVVGLTIAEAELRIRSAITDALTKLSREPWEAER